MPILNRLQAEYRPKGARFVLVYIQEAHASDRWPISSARYNDGVVVDVKAHTTLRDRVAAARALVASRGVELPVACDAMDDAFLRGYSPWPFRFYVLAPGMKVAYKAMPRDCTYSVAELRAKLDAIVGE